MKKRILAFLLAVSIAVSMLVLPAAYWLLKREKS